MNAKPIAKSLHTVTVLVKLARAEMEIGSLSAEDAVDLILLLLDLGNAPDPYELRAAALRQLLK